MPPYHTHAAIVATGDELAIGQSLNTNSRWLADRLMGLGIETVEHVIVGDDAARLAATLRRLTAELSLVIVTGGLGPTLDDVTRDALAEVMGDTLITDEASLAAIERRFASRGRTLTDNQRLQALRPSRAVSLPNDVGTAPGLYGVVGGSGGGGGEGTGEEGGADVFCLPGPPRELRPMFERDVLPRLRPDPARAVRTRLLHLIGIGEGDAAARLGDLMARTRSPLVGITAAGAVLTVRLRAVAPHETEAEAHLDAAERQVRDALGAFIFGRGDQTLEGVVLDLMRSRARTLATVESCTGGGLGALITRVSGASDVLLGGWITYSNELKQQQVGVPPDLLAAHGAVSDPVARAMAAGGLERSGATDCLSITGIAGPGGGTESKPVGTVYIGRAWREPSSPSAPIATEARRFLISGDRDDVRDRSARLALAMLYFALTPAAADPAAPTPPRAPTLLWELPQPPSSPQVPSSPPPGLGDGPDPPYTPVTPRA